ncbi:mechanosensitive ion channel family protein [Aerococcus suis]|uniref:Small conductance mechanosensitive channel n=1 Tax=Aerococcus suis TaxID=371602 RepID=A0A1W1Y1X2_9LACT|nr:mechanosensitive ion channel family protein [Aerococcus suis]MCI7240686.1 mechanosensitive ion channel family protein [Aerococcus suis]MDD7757914.1 mechanosensitive ion channel family protein [Aerococcus suis]MDY4646834.1 mechanosensitive ion channel family protein [Aerococcus suis]SMC30137.1 small conductance mechanosensitive channel [Aerococcus suis]
MTHFYNRIVNYFNNLDIEGIFDLVISRGVQLIFTIILLSLLRWFAERLVSIYFNRNNISEKAKQRHLTLKKLLDNIIQYTYYFFLGYSILAILGVPIATLLAGAGVASVAIGLGAQGFVSDMVNGLFILLERQYDVGDMVTINDYEGFITNIGMRTTVLQSVTGAVHFIPNRNILEVTNESRCPRRTEVDLVIDPDVNMEKLNAVIHETVEASLPNHDLTEAPEYYGVCRDLDGRLVYRVRFMCINDHQWDVETYYYELLTNALAKNGIEQPIVLSTKQVTTR